MTEQGTSREWTADDKLRVRAERRVKSQADLRGHLLIYVLVNAFLVMIWFVTGPAFFWPVFPLAGWGIGVVMHAWDAYGPDAVTEARIQREMNRMRERR